MNATFRSRCPRTAPRGADYSKCLRPTLRRTGLFAPRHALCRANWLKRARGALTIVSVGSHPRRSRRQPGAGTDNAKEVNRRDPSIRIRSQLGNIWQVALFGFSAANENLGCRDQGRQYAHTGTPAGIFSSSEFSVIFDLWRDMLWEVDAEVEANHEWAVCMAEAGFGDFARQRDAEESIRGRVWAETGHLHGEWEWRVQQLRPQVADELRQLELETAAADLNCRVATDFHARVAAHQFEVESAFVARYGAALEEVRLAAEQSGLTWLPDDGA